MPLEQKDRGLGLVIVTRTIERPFSDGDLRLVATFANQAATAISNARLYDDVTKSSEELEIRVQLLKGQYTDPAMQAELDKPENRRDVRGRMLTEKTLDKLRSYATRQ